MLSYTEQYGLPTLNRLFVISCAPLRSLGFFKASVWLKIIVADYVYAYSSGTEHNDYLNDGVLM